MKVTGKTTDASLKKLFLILEKYSHTTVKYRRQPTRNPKSHDTRSYLRRLAAKKYRNNNKK